MNPQGICLSEYARCSCGRGGGPQSTGEVLLVTASFASVPVKLLQGKLCKRISQWTQFAFGRTFSPVPANSYFRTARRNVRPSSSEATYYLCEMVNDRAWMDAEAKIPNSWLHKPRQSQHALEDDQGDQAMADLCSLHQTWASEVTEGFGLLLSTGFAQS